MKTFFLALILGIFVGSIITHYFANPDAYERLKETKAGLFDSKAAAEPEPQESTPDKSAPARFEVGSGEFNPDDSAAETPTPKPLPAPAPIEAEEREAPPVEPTPKPDKEVSKSDELIEHGAQKAEEIVESVAEKAKEVANDAKPIIEQGIDLTIAAGIRAQYKLERRIDSDSIEISVKDKVVTLSGTVDSADTKNLAIEIAAFTKGVNGVEETLTVTE